MYMQQPVQPQSFGNPRTFSPIELRNYFLAPPSRTVFTLILLSLFLFILAIPLIVINTSFLTASAQSFLTTAALVILAIPLVYGGMRLVPYYLRSRPTDQEYDTWVRNWIPEMQRNGLLELGLDPSEILGQPLFVPSIVWPNTPEADFYRNEGYPLLKSDRDGNIHSSINRFIFFYPTRYAIAIFTCDINALYPRQYSRAQRYFYNDIVGVDLFSVTTQPGNTSGALRRFELRVTNGENLGVPVFISDPMVMQTVGALNALLRDKKYGSGRGPAGL